MAFGVKSGKAITADEASPGNPRQSETDRTVRRLCHVAPTGSGMSSEVLSRWASHAAEGGEVKDGVFLCKLVEALTGRPIETSPNNNLNAVKAAFEAMKDAGLPTASLTCSPQEVADGDVGAFSSLLWALAERFAISPLFPGADGQWKGAMMAWCQSVCGPRGVSVTDFHRSWVSGLAFCALVDASVEDESLISMKKLSEEHAAANLSLAFDVAKRALGVPVLIDAEEMAAGTPDERAVLVYVATLYKQVKPRLSWSVSRAPEAGSQAASASQRGGPEGAILVPEADEATMAQQSLRRAMLGRPQGPNDVPSSGAVSSEEVMRVAALIEELRDPINNVAEVLERAQGGQTTAEAKATFKELTERMRRLVEVLPDTIECTQEAQALEESIQAELQRVRARAEFEEAYTKRLIERQQQTRAMSALLQGNVANQFEQLRKPVLELLRVLDDRERHLKDEIGAVERDKIAILSQSQRVSEADHARMRSAEGKAEGILRTKIASQTWLETGHSVEDLLVGCGAGRIEGKADFPESFTDFNCTLDLRLEHHIVGACDHALRATEFEERKVLGGEGEGESSAARHNSSPAALMLGSGSNGALMAAGSSGGIRSILQQTGALQPHGGQAPAHTHKSPAWSMTVEGTWVRINEGGGAPVPGQEVEIERVLEHARRLPPREADEFLSQDFVRSILLGGAGQRQSDRVLQAALHESVAGRLPPTGGLSGDYAQAGGEVRAQLHNQISAPLGARTVDGSSVLAIGGWDGACNLHSLERLGGGERAWGLVGSLSSSRRGLAAACVNGKVYVLGGWDGNSYLSSVEVYSVASGTWSAARSMSQPRCFAACAVLGGKIYVAGGYYGSYNLDSAEVYDPEHDTWTPLPPMSCPRRGLAMGALEGCIFCVGGWDGKHNLATVEAYSLSTNKWHAVAPLVTPRCSAACAALGGRLYVCGGWDGDIFLDTVEAFELKLPGSAKSPQGEWSTAARMLTPRSYGALVAAGGRLVAMGGWDGVSARRLDSVEAFSVQSGRWAAQPTMTCPRYGLAAVVV